MVDQTILGTMEVKKQVEEIKPVKNDPLNADKMKMQLEDELQNKINQVIIY